MGIRNAEIPSVRRELANTSLVSKGLTWFLGGSRAMPNAHDAANTQITENTAIGAFRAILLRNASDFCPPIALLRE